MPGSNLERSTRAIVSGKRDDDEQSIAFKMMESGHYTFFISVAQGAD